MLSLWKDFSWIHLAKGSTKLLYGGFYNIYSLIWTCLTVNPWIKNLRKLPYGENPWLGIKLLPDLEPTLHFKKDTQDKSPKPDKKAIA